MFKFLRALDHQNAEAHRMFVELTDRMEEVGMFERKVDLDYTPTSLYLSRRRGPWDFHWGIQLADPKHRDLDTLRLFLGQAGALISVVRMVPRRPHDWNLEMESSLVYAQADFRELVNAAKESCTDHSHWLMTAKMLASFFLKQPA